MAVTLDTKEWALLSAYRDEDPKAESWIAPWALTGHGLSFDVAVATARRLCQRKLLEGNTDRGKFRGYSITDKGRAAL